MRASRLSTGPLNQTLQDYGKRVRQFRPNARLYLVNLILTGAAMGVFRLLFNFYVLSLGYDQSLLGNLVTVNSMAALLAALPMGYLADILGRKLSLILAGVLSSISILVMIFFPGQLVFYLMNALFGLGQSLAGVTMSPFLMENSGDSERTYLFSFASGMQTASGSLGNWIGGYLPTWAAGMRQVSATSSTAYGISLLVIASVALLGLLPLALIRPQGTAKSERVMFAPLYYGRKNPALLAKLILPMLVTSVGAGLIMPFMNVFFRQVHHQPDPVIGSLFAWGSLAMGIGLLVAPPLADRMGKIQLVVITQGLSIPFLIILGFTPWFWLAAGAYYIRLALMNMSGPVYQTFVMERVEPEARATVASLVSMSNNFGWALSPTISGWFQTNYGFGPSYLGTIVLYTVSVYLYWSYFWRKKGAPKNAPVPVPGN